MRWNRTAAVAMSALSILAGYSSSVVAGPEAQVVTKGTQAFWKYWFGKGATQAGSPIAKPALKGFVQTKPKIILKNNSAKVRKEDGSLSEELKKKKKEYEFAKTYDEFVCPEDVPYKDQRADCKEAQKRSFKPVRQKFKKVITGTIERRRD